MKIEWSRTVEGECSRLEDVPEDATIETIDGELCIGRCEGCRKPIMDGDDHGFGEDGDVACLECTGEGGEK